MENLSKWKLATEEKVKFIEAMTAELEVLRKKADISQGELAGVIGVSRQTYGSIERRERKMTWGTYLSLIMFYDNNKKTRQMLRSTDAYPYEIINRFNDGTDSTEVELGSFFDDNMKPILEKLDEQALHSLRTMIMVEYARCTKTPGDAVVRAFDGISFNAPQPYEKKATKALKAIKECKKRNDKQ